MFFMFIEGWRVKVQSKKKKKDEYEKKREDMDDQEWRAEIKSSGET